MSGKEGAKHEGAAGANGSGRGTGAQSRKATSASKTASSGRATTARRKTSTASTAKRKTTTKRATGRKKKKNKSIFRRIPLWVLVGCLCVVFVAYAVFLYRSFVGPYSFRWKALYGDVEYPEGSVRGIDISHYQEDIDWEMLRNADLQGSAVQFVFIKATEGSDQFDKNFNRNFFEAKRNGLVRGAYHFFSSQTPSKNQAEFFCRMVQLEPGDLPPVLDVEVNVGGSTGYSRAQLRKDVLKWLRIVEQHYGVKPIIYASYKFKTQYLDGKEFADYPFWIAHYYVDKLQYEGDWAFWQHTDVGKVHGIGGNVDVDLFNGEYEDLLDLCIPDSLAE